MTRRKTMFWALFVLDVTLVGLLLLVIFAIVSALGAFAAGIEEWPLFVCLGLILCTSSAGLIVSGKYAASGPRRVGLAIHGLALCAALMIVVSVGWMWFHAVRRRFLLPAGFQGDMYLLHIRRGAAPGEKTWWRTTYRIPNDGILATTDPPLAPGQLFIDNYDYLYPDGHLQELKDVGPGTLPDTAENRSDHSRAYTYFPRSSGDATATQCLMGSDEISIGTKASLLSPRRPTNIDAYFVQHPQLCPK